MTIRNCQMHPGYASLEIMSGELLLEHFSGSCQFHFLNFFAGEAGFPGLRRLNNRQQTTDNNRQQVGAQNVTFQKLFGF